MKRKVFIFWFSPVYHTRELCRSLGQTIAGNLTEAEILECDLTDYHPVPFNLACGDTDIAIIAAPVYAGRIPEVFADKLKQIQANKTPALLLVSYGNRAYENALAELKKVTMQSGFMPVGACACVARHTIALIYGEGRPDHADLQELGEFGKRSANLLEKKQKLRIIEVPGEIPTDAGAIFPLPQTVNNNCVHCGICQQKCPVQAIDYGDPKIVDLKKCICCMRCVALCPESARVPKEEFIAGITEKLRPVCMTRHANEFFDVQISLQ